MPIASDWTVTSTAGEGDRSALLTSTAVGDLLAAAVAHGGGTLVSWQLGHVDNDPYRGITATYTATVQWSFGRREELLGASAHQRDGPAADDEQAVTFADGARQVTVWLYPRDPDLPGLVRAAFPISVAAILTEHLVLGHAVRSDQVKLEMIAYRPRRRAVLRAVIDNVDRQVLFIKVLRPQLLAGIVQRHELLLRAGVPAPRIAWASPDGLLFLHELSGRPLARAILDAESPCSAQALIDLLDALPPGVAGLDRRNPWSAAVDQYANMVATSLPSETSRVQWLAGQISSGLAGIPDGVEPTHGDFHEGQLFVAGGAVCGVLDVDTLGPGRRVDDLGCLLAHLSTVQRMNPDQLARVQSLSRAWLPVLDRCVDPVELRLRAAAVAISLATGPYRGQEPDWEGETTMIVDAAERLVRSIG